ncbi:MAG TPA: NAD(P)H nitroreductase [Firmicutes bacterium]|nr:NAD(P)H nitroreductase [Bacillota bacterium]
MLDLLLKRRSRRKFKPLEVEQEKIEYILKCALLSPTSQNRRCWEFVAVTEPERLAALAEAKERGSQFLQEAPLAVVVFADTGKSNYWVEDCSIASIIIQLAAETLGLGSCWIQIRGRFAAGNTSSGEYVKKVLNIPEQYDVECIIAIGYPDEEKEPYSVDNLDYNKIHYNVYQDR